jgi:hypothetical protein
MTFSISAKIAAAISELPPMASNESACRQISASFFPACAGQRKAADRKTPHAMWSRSRSLRTWTVLYRLKAVA